MNLAKFEVLERYNSPEVYFYDLKHGCLIAIPSWNWSFLMNYAMDFKDERPLLIQTLSKYISNDDVENVTDTFYDFVFSEFN
ncbi:YueH family protein (plasmid) [Bacillus cereus]|nr:YueH family protein [Bacillus cereus]